MASNDQREALIQILEQRVDIEGRFTDIRRLPSGGSDGHFSVVMSGADSVASTRVALKFLLPSFTGTYRDDSFHREAELLQGFAGHPDIIQVVSPRIDFIETLTTATGFPVPVQFSCYALEMASTDVGTVIANSQWNADQLLVGFRAMCRGVQRLHSQRVVHRDVKPPNFLVMPDGSIRLSDLGTARKLDGQSPALAAYTLPPGDLRYSAPELLAGLHDSSPEIAFAGDFFSLGATLFEMFSGTSLGARIYDQQFLADLTQTMTNVKSDRRRYVFDQLVPTIADARPIPSVASFGAPVPRCIQRMVDQLVRNIASLDYRRRVCDFSVVFNRIQQCVLVLRNETAYLNWLAEKRRRRAISTARQRGGVL